MYKPDLVLYHYPCQDGITAAGVVRNYLPNRDIQFIPARYDNKSIDDYLSVFSGKDVLLVDFSFKKNVLDQLAQACNTMLILDHHESAERELSEYMIDSSHTAETYPEQFSNGKVQAIFDMKRSGAGLAWDFFNKGHKRPAFVNYVEHMDLGRNEFTGTTDVKFWLRAQKMDVDLFAKLVQIYQTDDDMERIIVEGRAINQFVYERLRQLKDEVRWGRLRMIKFPFIITDYAFSAEAASWFLTEFDVNLAVAFYFTKTGFGASLRSRNGINCAIIAESFGGGGHAQAAGFNAAWDDMGQVLEALDMEGTDIFDIEPSNNNSWFEPNTPHGKYVPDDEKGD